MLQILPIFDQIRDEIAILSPFYPYFLLLSDPSKFCRDLRASPPPPWFPPYGGGRLPHGKISTAIPVYLTNSTYVT